MNMRRHAMAASVQRTRTGVVQFDGWLLGAAAILVLLGLVMVASASITVADRTHGAPLYFFWRQSIAVLFGVMLGFAVLKTPLSIWEQASVPLLIAGIALLIAVLIPGIGKEVNGSMRWIDLGPVNLQSSEPVKLCMIAYLAGYMVRHEERIRATFAGFIRPIAVVTLVAGLLLLEPDYGAAVVIFATVLGMLFMGGVPLSRYFAWMAAAGVTLASLAVLSPYRLQRLTSFMNPWDDPYNSGFQLTQALIAFGRGDWFGVGLGGSIQKLFYLPEAHTDFVFAVMAEELGLVSTILVIVLYFFIIWRAFVVAQVAEHAGRQFPAMLAYGIGLLLGIQAYVNIGVNLGVLPTKGLTLPLMSYGSNSMVINCVLIALLVRVEFENRQVSDKRLPEVAASYVA